MGYVQQFHLVNEELERSGYYNLMNENKEQKAESGQSKKRKYKCPFCQYPFKIYNLINSKIVSTKHHPVKTQGTDSLVEDLQTVGNTICYFLFGNISQMLFTLFLFSIFCLIN